MSRRDARPPRRRDAAAEAWLQGRPPLEELRAAYPQVWEQVEAEMAGLVARGDVEELKAYVHRVAAGGGAASVEDEVRRQMMVAALRTTCLSLASGGPDGPVRLGRVEGRVMQRLLFARGLERKPVSMRWFSLLWPRLRTRRRLMPLVGPKGVYCFYSRELVAALAREVGDRSCLEIAAGDGTLSRFLREAGVDVTATDDHSWSSAVEFPDDVVRVDAVTALRRYEPAVVVCSWPPAGNRFERAVFTTRSVQTYVVIASRHEFAAGAFDDYRAQAAFEWAEVPSLSRLVLPPELDSAVYVFRRRGSTSS
ncbi:hypothetical protein CLV35_1314 [Motilibacter peucedani]|uniref:SAM-dependent methyltransferase n=1 Tax=Motilibacter peucedani TaxID=598650 RepID=A0A420XS26_9ACTN|nr:SAM-dependent methyltransferase [Motilibacter peucedani]RKS77620.1 hypothetical protein CLV35_1314 [Motilibacter peucedani]